MPGSSCRWRERKRRLQFRPAQAVPSPRGLAWPVVKALQHVSPLDTLRAPGAAGHAIVRPAAAWPPPPAADQAIKEFVEAFGGGKTLAQMVKEPALASLIETVGACLPASGGPGRETHASPLPEVEAAREARSRPASATTATAQPTPARRPGSCLPCPPRPLRRRPASRGRPVPLLPADRAQPHHPEALHHLCLAHDGQEDGVHQGWGHPEGGCTRPGLGAPAAGVVACSSLQTLAAG